MVHGRISARMSSEGEGREFESRRVHQFFKKVIPLGFLTEWNITP